MALDIRRADERAKAAAPSIARVIPVGEAFNCAIARRIADPNPYDGLTRGQIDLWASDHYHASTQGYYLEALTIFAAVTHTDPRKLGRNEQAATGLRRQLTTMPHDLAWPFFEDQHRRRVRMVSLRCNRQGRKQDQLNGKAKHVSAKQQARKHERRVGVTLAQA